MVIADSVVASRAYRPRTPTTDIANRVTRVAIGLGLFGAGISCMLQAQLGVSPWEMFHKGVSRKTDISVGIIIEVVGFLMLLLWIPLRQRPGIGTVMNVIEIGAMVNLVSPHLPDTNRLVPRLAMLFIGILIVAIGSGIYIGAGLGPGPRDGLMMGLKARGLSVRLGRTIIELTVGLAGFLLGSRPGIGTFLFMFGIGPLVQVFLPIFSLPTRQPTRRPPSDSVG